MNHIGVGKGYCVVEGWWEGRDIDFGCGGCGFGVEGEGSGGFNEMVTSGFAPLAFGCVCVTVNDAFAQGGKQRCSNVEDDEAERATPRTARPAGFQYDGSRPPIPVRLMGTGRTPVSPDGIKLGLQRVSLIPPRIG